MRPRIAVNCDVEDRGRERCFLYTDYLDAIYDAGGEPWVLPPDPRGLSGLDDCGGVLLTGGDDYVASVDDPENPPPDTTWIHARRERIDLLLGRETIDRDLPVLGICAGFQLLVLLEGGSVIGDIPSAVGTDVRHRRDRPDEPRPIHAVHFEGRGPDGLESSVESVVSHHHQGIGTLPEGWRAWATAPDGVIEAAVGSGRWQLGVQWHPELTPRDAFGRSIFSSLVRAASGVLR